MTLQRLVQTKKAFFIPVLIFILTGIVFLGLFSKAEIHLVQNSWNSAFSDVFFKYLTYAGDGWAFAAALPVFLFKQWRHLVGYVIAAILTLFLSAGLKSYFKEMPRPVKYFEGKAELHLVEGVHNHSFKSFPSGHTTTALACWGFVALVSRSAGWQLTLAVLALLVGYSRIHISQHFLMDVVGGTFLGTFIAVVSYLLATQLKAPWAVRKVLNNKRER